MHSSSARTPKLQLADEQASTEECWSPQKKIPNIQGQRRSYKKTVGGAKSHLESHPIPAREEGSNKTFCEPGPRGPTETEPDLPLSV